MFETIKPYFLDKNLPEGAPSSYVLVVDTSIFCLDGIGEALKRFVKRNGIVVSEESVEKKLRASDSPFMRRMEKEGLPLLNFLRKRGNIYRCDPLKSEQGRALVRCSTLLPKSAAAAYVYEWFDSVQPYLAAIGKEKKEMIARLTESGKYDFAESNLERLLSGKGLGKEKEAIADWREQGLQMYWEQVYDLLGEKMGEVFLASFRKNLASSTIKIAEDAHFKTTSQVERKGYLERTATADADLLLILAGEEAKTKGRRTLICTRDSDHVQLLTLANALYGTEIFKNRSPSAERVPS